MESANQSGAAQGLVSSDAKNRAISGGTTIAIPIPISIPIETEPIRIPL